MTLRPNPAIAVVVPARTAAPIALPTATAKRAVNVAIAPTGKPVGSAVQPTTTKCAPLALATAKRRVMQDVASAVAGGAETDGLQCGVGPAVPSIVIADVVLLRGVAVVKDAGCAASTAKAMADAPAAKPSIAATRGLTFARHGGATRLPVVSSPPGNAHTTP